MGILTLSPQAERVHHTLDPQVFRNLTIIITTHTQISLYHNHLTIIETKIVHDDLSHAIAFEMHATTLVEF